MHDRLQSWIDDGRERLLRRTGRLRRAGQIVVLSIEEARRALIFERAANLAFVTLMSLIPLAVLFVGFAGLFGGGERLIDWVQDRVFPWVAPEFHGELETWMDQNISKSAFRAGPTGVVNVAAIGALLVAALGLMTTSERYFNVIWRSSSRRSYLQRALVFWVLLTISPLAIALSITMSDIVMPKGGFVDRVVTSFEIVEVVLSSLGSIAVSAIALSMLVNFLPSTRVGIRSAILGGTTAAVLWTASKYGFVLYVARSAETRSFYGQLASVPLFLFWIYLSWLAVLIGGVVAYVFQHRERLLRQRLMVEDVRRHSSFTLGIRLLVSVTESFRRGEEPPPIGTLADRFECREDRLQRVARNLVEQDVLVADADDPTVYRPARAPERIELDDLGIRLIELDASVDARRHLRRDGTPEETKSTPDVLDAAWQGFLTPLRGRTLADALDQGYVADAASMTESPST